MELHQIVLAATVLTAGLAAGVFFTFTTLVIPGLMDSDQRTGLQGFKVIDGRLQPSRSSIDWQPAFGAAIFGPAVLTVATVVLCWPHSSTTVRLMVIGAAAVYNLGFWVPTITTIVPFNNRVRDSDLDAMGPREVAALHREFERNWRGWNLVRTVSSTAAFALLVGVAVAGRW